MNRRADRIDKTLIAIVGCKVNCHFGLRRHGAGNFNIEHYFPIIRIRRRRLVAGMVDRNRNNVRRLNSNLLKEDFQIAGAKTAAQFDDRDGLSATVEGLAIERGGKVIAFRKLSGR